MQYCTLLSRLLEYIAVIIIHHTTFYFTNTYFWPTSLPQTGRDHWLYRPRSLLYRPNSLPHRPRSLVVECVRLIIGSFCWVDYLANKGFCTSLPVTLSRYRMRFDVFSVRTVVNVPLFYKKSIYVFNDK